jgi:excisionase family DNA binding protein
MNGVLTIGIPDELVEAIAAKVAERVAQSQEGVGESGCGRSPWMSAASAAVYLDWPRQRIYKLAAQGAIPHYKQDGRLLFNQTEIDHWLAQYQQPSDWINPGNRAISP